MYKTNGILNSIIGYNYGTRMVGLMVDVIDTLQRKGQSSLIKIPSSFSPCPLTIVRQLSEHTL